MAATVIAATVAVFAIVALFRYMVSVEHGEENVGCFQRRIVRAIPLQALKIAVVVWQILTQVCVRQDVFAKQEVFIKSRTNDRNSVYSAEGRIVHCKFGT